MRTKPRIKDIAEKAGVSAATVSRALGEESELVAEPTRTLIRQVAQELNYRPNVSARNLRTRKSMSILMVVRDIGNPFYLEVLKGVEAVARKSGYSVLMGNTEDDPAREAEYFNMLSDGHADGMVLMTGKLPASSMAGFAYPEKLPIVVALEVIENSGFPHVQIDNISAARKAVQHLIELGHKRIAHISGPLSAVMSVHRREGYRQAMAAAGLAIPETYEQEGEFHLHSGRAACRALFELEQKPTAIFVANDEMAFGAINELRQSGYDVPGDVSVVGFDDLFLGEAFFPPLTTVSQPRDMIGQQAMSLLLDILAGKPGPRKPIVLETQLRLRGSTAPLIHPLQRTQE
ncbi:MAG: LacI family DNA-binding transcriptional regulator [Gammaproteobacteria bacterium]|nr:LacI family DNA-binding transcriptional regulator [Gammaproteobacteria bacterium]